MQHRLVVAVVEVDALEPHPERPGGQWCGAGVGKRRRDLEQIEHADHGPTRLLHGLELVHDLFERAAHEQHVLEEEEGRAHGDETAIEEQHSADQDEGESRHHHAPDDPPHAEERALAADRALHGLGAVLDEAPHRVVGRAVRAEILDRVQPLLDAAVQPCHRAELVARLEHRSMAVERHGGGGQRDVHDHADGDPPVEHGEHHEHAGHEEERTGHPGDDPTEEVGHVGDVAVDPLDQFAGRVATVELVVEAEDVVGETQSQPVRGVPRRDGGGARDEDLDDLTDDHDGEEAESERSDGRGVAITGPIDHGADDEWRGEQEPGRSGDRDTQGDPPTSVGPQKAQQSARTDSARLDHPTRFPVVAVVTRLGFRVRAARVRSRT